jgi:hypothetical protein
MKVEWEDARCIVFGRRLDGTAFWCRQVIVTRGEDVFLHEGWLAKDIVLRARMTKGACIMMPSAEDAPLGECRGRDQLVKRPEALFVSLGWAIGRAKDRAEAEGLRAMKAEILREVADRDERRRLNRPSLRPRAVRPVPNPAPGRRGRRP